MNLPDGNSENPESTAAFVALLLANLVPVAGVVLWDWNAGGVVLYYWFENLAIGICTIPKIAKASTGNSDGAGHAPVDRGVHLWKFALYFTLFTIAHAVLIVLLFFSTLFEAGPPVDFEAIGEVFNVAFVVGVALMIGQHVSELTSDRSYLDQPPARVARQPYRRLIAMHLLLALGALVLVRWDSPAAGLIALVAAKVVIDEILTR